MPGRPHHTPKMKRCVDEVMGKGHSESSAYAICTTSLQKAGEDIFVAASMRHLHLVGASGPCKTEEIDGREHLIVPVVALMEEVIHAVNADHPEYVPASSLLKSTEDWKGHPIVLGHPTRNGKQISAHSPEVLEKHGVGSIRQSFMNGVRLGMEAIIDPQRLETLGQPELLADIRAGKPIEVSVGAFVTTNDTPGVFNGKPYKAEWSSITPDHLAILHKGIGACSLAMGCGAHRAAEERPISYLVTAAGFQPYHDPGTGQFSGNGQFSGGPNSSGQFSLGSSSERRQGGKAVKGRRQSDKTGGKFKKGRRQSDEVIGGKFTTAETSRILAATSEQSFQDRESKIQSAVSKKFGNTSGLYPSSIWAQAIFDDHVIIRKEDVLYSVDYTVDGDNIDFSDDPVEVRMAYVTASDFRAAAPLPDKAQVDCAACGGTGSKNGHPCEVCDGLGQMKAAAGARHSSDDRALIQGVHDHAVSLGADCSPRDYKVMSTNEPILRAACRCQEGESAMTKDQKTEAIKALIADKHSGFTADDEKMLDTASDERIESFKVAAAARATEVRTAEEKATADAAKAAETEAKLKAAESRPLTEDEFMKVAPAPLKALIERSIAQDTARKLELVTTLKTAQAEFSESELAAESLERLERMARALKVHEPKPDYSGRAMPRTAAAEDFTPPDPYAADIKALQARDSVN